jgi:hypothetical protein
VEPVKGSTLKGSGSAQKTAAETRLLKLNRREPRYKQDRSKLQETPAIRKINTKQEIKPKPNTKSDVL